MFANRMFQYLTFLFNLRWICNVLKLTPSTLPIQRTLGVSVIHSFFYDTKFFGLNIMFSFGNLNHFTKFPHINKWNKNYFLRR